MFNASNSLLFGAAALASSSNPSVIKKNSTKTKNVVIAQNSIRVKRVCFLIKSFIVGYESAMIIFNPVKNWPK